jgi:hypothetical protein
MGPQLLEANCKTQNIYNPRTEYYCLSAWSVSDTQFLWLKILVEISVRPSAGLSLYPLSF